MASSLLASVLVAAGGAVGGPPGSAAPWASTIGEPLHDSSNQALELTQHLKAMGAKFYGAWTCPACFKQMNLFGKQAGAELPMWSAASQSSCRSKPKPATPQRSGLIPPGFSPMGAEKWEFSPWKP